MEGVCIIAAHRHWITTFTLLLTLALLPGCRRSAPDTGPTLQPTLTATPRSTPLPPVATAVPPGSEDNPLVMLFARTSSASRNAINSALEALQTDLLEQADLTVAARTVSSGADALESLCASTANPVAVAWVDGITYAAAAAQGCGIPALLTVRESGGTTSAGEEVQIIVNSGGGVSGLSGLAGRTFCRLSVDDLYTWIVPSLMLSASGVTPVELGAINDVDSTADLVAAVADRDCDAAGISARDYETLQTSRVRAINQTVTVPYAIFVMPPSAPLGVRNAVSAALVAMAADETRAEPLNVLLDQAQLLPADAEALAGWDAFIQATRLDFAILGD